MFNRCLVGIASCRNSYMSRYWILLFGLNWKREVAVRLMSGSELWPPGRDPGEAPQHCRPLNGNDEASRAFLEPEPSHLLEFCGSLLFLSFEPLLLLYLLFPVLFYFPYFQNVMLGVWSWRFHTENHLKNQQRKSKVRQLLSIIHYMNVNFHLRHEEQVCTKFWSYNILREEIFCLNHWTIFTWGFFPPLAPIVKSLGSQSCHWRNQSAAKPDSSRRSCAETSARDGNGLRRSDPSAGGRDHRAEGPACWLFWPK